MRVFLMALAVLALAAGCANNRAGAPDIAPSRQASLNDANSGWSVPPGQKHVSDAASPAQAAQPAPSEAAQAAADQAPSQAANQASSPAPAQQPQPAVKPLVPAFPARMQEAQVSGLQTVHFGFDDWNLTAEAKALLDANARWLKANPQVSVKIGGHCDERGSPEYNLALGERRANRVREYLISQGVPADNMIAVSYGEEMPIDPGHNPAAWAKNRRAEFNRTDGRRVSGDQAQTPSS